MNRMTPHRKKVLLRERTRLSEELGNLSHLIRGSLVVGKKKCGRKGCPCQEEALHPHVVLSTTYPEGKTRIVYVPQVSREAAAGAVGAYRRARELLEELSTINVELLKARELSPGAESSEPGGAGTSGGKRP